jgi:phosphoribosylformylglycinamidine (FGAM) synthase PurS component
VDTAKLPDDVYREALLQGLKALSERAMSKITKEAYPDEAERKAAIKAKAEDNIDKMYRGEVKITGKASVEKPKGAVMTEAMRLARNLVKDFMKSKKIKISTVKASEITKAATVLLGQDPSIIETAKANLAARANVPIKVDLSALIHADPELVRKADAKAAKAKADKPLSAKQAGKVAPRAKGSKPQPQATA